MIETVKWPENTRLWKFICTTVFAWLLVGGAWIVGYSIGRKRTKTLFAEEASEWVKDLPLAIQVKLKKSLQDVPDELKDAPLFIDATPASIEKVENPQ